MNTARTAENTIIIHSEQSERGDSWIAWSAQTGAYRGIAATKEAAVRLVLLEDLGLRRKAQGLSW